MLKNKLANLFLSVFIGLQVLPHLAVADTTTKQMEADIAPATFARFVPERKDDFAWENDLVAFRAYGPALRNGAENAGVDCWLKRVDYPIINRWYTKHTQGVSYHKDHGEGVDNYHVGSSAGCGSTALWLNDKREPLETYTKWKILEQSIERTVFILSYEHTVQGNQYKEDKKITIELGKRLYHVESTFWIDGVLAENLSIAVGLATHDEKAAVSMSRNSGWLSAWETIDTFGLGTAVMVEPKRIQSLEVINSQGVKDQGHALYIINTDAQGKVEYYAGYGWAKAKSITTKEKWHSYLSAFSTGF